MAAIVDDVDVGLTAVDEVVTAVTKATAVVDEEEIDGTTDQLSVEPVAPTEDPPELSPLQVYMVVSVAK